METKNLHGLYKVLIFVILLSFGALIIDTHSQESNGYKNEKNTSKSKRDESFIRDLGRKDVERTEPEPVPFHFLPKTDLGYIDWDEALKNKSIKPLPTIDKYPVKAFGVIDLDIIFRVNTALEDVKFSHSSHTAWLDCSACHPVLFRMRRGSTPVSMKKIRQGDYCGRCHGIVAFPLYDCDRCHSYSRD